MISVKLTAADVRLIQAARTPDEYAGVTKMMCEKIETAETVKRLSGKPEREKPHFFDWRDCRRVAERVLGADNVKMPPFPDSAWFRRVSTVCREYGFTEEYMERVANYAKEHLRAPHQLSFLVTQHERILNGHYSYPNRQGNLHGKQGVRENHLAALPRLQSEENE